MVRSQQKLTNPTMWQQRKWTNSNQRSNLDFCAMRSVTQAIQFLPSLSIVDQKTIDRIRWNDGKAGKAMQSSISQRCTASPVQIDGQPFSMCFGRAPNRTPNAKNVNWQRPTQTIRTATVPAVAARTVDLAA